MVDQVSGTMAQQPGLQKVKELLHKGDTLVVWRLDRLGRSLRDPIPQQTVETKLNPAILGKALCLLFFLYKPAQAVEIVAAILAVSD